MFITYLARLQRMAHQILQSDLDDIDNFNYLEVVSAESQGAKFISVPLYQQEYEGLIVTVWLTANQRPKVEWSRDKSQMYNEFKATSAGETLWNGVYQLDSQQTFEFKIEDGIPSRQDYTDADANATAWCCSQARSFILADPTLHNRISTYIQLTSSLVLECSNNGGGKVFLWRKV